MYTVSAAELTVEGTTDILVKKYIPPWGCLASLFSDKGRQSCSKLPFAVYKLPGMRKIATTAYHLSGKVGVERVNRTMAQMLGMVANERHDEWEVHLPYVKFANNNSVSAATGLVPNEVHKNRLPRLPLTVFEHDYVEGHKSLARDHLDYGDLAADHQRCAYALVREQHVFTISRVERCNSALSDAIKQLPVYTVGGWVWIHNTASTACQGAKSGVDAKVFKANLSLNWTGPSRF